MTAREALACSKAGAHKKLDGDRLALALPGDGGAITLYVTRPNGLGYRRASDDDHIDPNAPGWAPSQPLTEEEMANRKSRTASAAPSNGSAAPGTETGEARAGAVEHPGDLQPGDVAVEDAADAPSRETAEQVLERRLAERPTILGRGERELPCAITDAEASVLGKKLADAIDEYEQEEAEQAEQKASMKQALADLKARQRRIALVLRRRTEERMVPYVIEADYAAGHAREIRTDTGEVLSSRPLTDRERQPSLLPEQKPAVAASMAVHSDAPEHEDK